MDERWAKIERIFNRVLETQQSRRGAVLEESCAGDESLPREVESRVSTSPSTAPTEPSKSVTFVIPGVQPLTSHQ